MKTSYHLRMFIVVATVSAIACSDNEPYPDNYPNPSRNSGTYSLPNPGPPGYLATSLSQHQTGEYHTWVTTWTPADNNTYIGFVAQAPIIGYSTISAINNGDTTLVDLFDPGKMPAIDSLQDDYIWATPNNVLLLHFKGATPESVPPLPLELVMNY